MRLSYLAGIKGKGGKTGELVAATILSSHSCFARIFLNRVDQGAGPAREELAAVQSLSRTKLYFW